MIRPILFSGDMVRAILDGRKTETRRPVNPPFEMHANGYLTRPDGHGGRFGPYPCPYGKPGDLLWVRETWGIPQHDAPSQARDVRDVVYRADGDKEFREYGYRWRPSIHMPRWACRIVTEVVSVRVERLRDITEEGARAEGFERRAAFLSAYQAMYKLVPDANPWVRVVRFKTAAVGNEAAQAVMRAAA